MFQQSKYLFCFVLFWRGKPSCSRKTPGATPKIVYYDVPNPLLGRIQVPLLRQIITTCKNIARKNPDVTPQIDL